MSEIRLPTLSPVMLACALAQVSAAGAIDPEIEPESVDCPPEINESLFDNGWEVLFQESFEDGALPTRGWYDGERYRVEAGGRSGRALAYHFEKGHIRPDPTRSVGARRLFEPTEALRLRFWLRLSPGWEWSGRAYGPHLMHFLTTENSKYHGPGASRLTLFIESWNGKLRLGASDIENRDAKRGLTQGELRGGYNGRFYDSDEELFRDDEWHLVVAEFRLNTLDFENDRPNRDGVVRGWVDGQLVVEHTDVVFRTTDFPNMKFNQFLIAPYFGPGVPEAQSLWIDELRVERPE